MYKDELLILLLGSNIGNRYVHLEEARYLLKRDFGEIYAESAIYETPPWGKTDQESFLNQALVFSSEVRPDIALDSILKIEQEMGRERFEKWGPRIIDIDMIFFGQLVYDSEDLIIPHPYMHQRSFVLEPLMEIVPDFNHPILDRKVKDLYAELIEHQQ